MTLNQVNRQLNDAEQSRLGAQHLGVAGREVEVARHDREPSWQPPAPAEAPSHFHVYNQFVIRVAATVRDGLRAALSARRIGTEIYYPIPLHLQTCFAALGHAPGDFPNAEAAARETLALPIYAELSEDSQRYAVAAIARFYKEQARRHQSGERAA